MAQGRYPIKCPQCGAYHDPACPSLEEIWAKAAALRALRDAAWAEKNPQHTVGVYVPRRFEFGFLGRRGIRNL